MPQYDELGNVISNDDTTPSQDDMRLALQNRPVARNRAGQPVKVDPLGTMGGAISQGLAPMLYGAAKGTASAIAGAPGDIESLGRSAINYFAPDTVSQNTALPTSEEMYERIPKSVNQTPEQQYSEMMGGKLGQNVVAPIVGLSDPAAMSNLQVGLSIKNKGGNWIDGWIDKTLNHTKRAINTSDEKPVVLKHYGLTESELAELPREERLKMFEPFLTPENKTRSSINNWIDTKLRNYIKNDLATSTDPVRELHDEGITHIPDIRDETRVASDNMKMWRETHGFLAEGHAKTELGKSWEARSDSAVSPEYAENLADTFPSTKGYLKDLLEKDPNAVVHTLDNNAMHDLGFEHAIDELQNAMLDENLPQQLRLRPKDVDKMSVKDALRHVAKINDYRIKQADKVATANRDTFATHFPPAHEYDNGYRWHELKMPETDFNPNVIQNNGKFSILEPDQKLSWKDPESGKVLFNSPEEAKTSYNKAKNYQTLDEALKNEGDQMGHCVGGYTKDVANGNTRIFTLRDNKNRPHVTIEAVPTGVSPIDAYEANKTFIESNPELAEQAEELNNYADAPYEYISGLHRLIKEYGGKFIEPPPSPVHNIEQIRGKGNGRVADKYHDYVHAFLNKNEKDLNEVYDTHNVDVVDTYQPSSIKHPDKALIKNQLYSGKLPRFLKRKDLDDLAEKEYQNILDNYEYKDVDNGNEWINAREAAEKYHPGKPELQRNFIRGSVGYPELLREAPKRQKFTGDKKLDDILNKVRPYEDLSPNSNYDLGGISAPQENQEYVVGYHIPEDVARPLASGKLTNKDIGDNNLQGYAPEHVGGAYFWSHPSIARFQKDRWHETVPDEYQHEAPIMKFRMKKKEHNLVPDEDTDAKNWQDSFTSGSFATTTPVDMKNLVAIYSNNPEKTRQHIIESIGKLNNKVNNFTPEHLEALKEYQAAYVNSKVGGYSQMQNMLRKGQPLYKEDVPGTTEKLVENLKNLFNHASLEEPQLVYRGVKIPFNGSLDYLYNLKIGDTFSDKGITSASKDSNIVARKFSDKNQPSDKIVNFVINLPKGSKAIDLEKYLGSEAGHEKEIAIAPNTVFKVTKTTHGEGFPRGGGMKPDKDIRTIYVDALNYNPPEGHKKGGLIKSKVYFAENKDEMKLALVRRK